MKERLLKGNRRALVESFWRFDPAGVSEDRVHTPQEYRELIEVVARMLALGRTDSEIAEWLQEELSRNWGIDPLEGKVLAATVDMRLSWLAD